MAVPKTSPPGLEPHAQVRSTPGAWPGATAHTSGQASGSGRTQAPSPWPGKKKLASNAPHAPEGTPWAKLPR